jgi:hypothetical protein
LPHTGGCATHTGMRSCATHTLTLCASLPVQVIGRNCRFLQGPETERQKVCAAHAWELHPTLSALPTTACQPHAQQQISHKPADDADELCLCCSQVMEIRDAIREDRCCQVQRHTRLWVCFGCRAGCSHSTLPARPPPTAMQAQPDLPACGSQRAAHRQLAHLPRTQHQPHKLAGTLNMPFCELWLLLHLTRCLACSRSPVCLPASAAAAVVG